MGSERKIKICQDLLCLLREANSRMQEKVYGEVGSCHQSTRVFNAVRKATLFYLLKTLREWTVTCARHHWMRLMKQIKRNTKNIKTRKFCRAFPNMKWHSGCRYQCLM